MSEVRNTVGAIEAMGHKDLVLMHCVSVYPCPTRQMNLQFLTSLREEFGYEIGLSDHTENSLAAAAAVALGVTWIEKHFTLDRTSQGFDHAYAMEPEMLTEYIQDVRAIEAAMLGSEDKVGEQEASVKVRARRGLYAARDIQPGEVIQEDDVLIVRPEAALICAAACCGCCHTLVHLSVRACTVFGRIGRNARARGESERAASSAATRARSSGSP